MSEPGPAGSRPLRIAVATIVHHPLDARIRSRQIEAMLRAGHQVSYAAPFSATGTPTDPQLRCHDLPRARMRNRLSAIRAAAAWLSQAAAEHDVVLVHDPELVPALIRARRSGGAHLIWDVHEDNPAAVRSRAYIPAALRAVAAAAMRRLERRAERTLTLLLAEAAYQSRFTRPHAHVPNTPWVSPLRSAERQPRAVYLGSVTRVRGSQELCRLGALLKASGVELHIIGPVDDAVSAGYIDAAEGRGEVVLHGRMPNDLALQFVRESLVGVSLLQDVPNHRHSMPTKVLEYAAVGTPVVTTALPLAEQVVHAGPGGVVVGFGTPEQVARAAHDAVVSLAHDPGLVEELGRQGFETVEQHYNWNRDSLAFLQALQP